MSKENEPTVVVSLTVKDAAEALEFYSAAFGSKEIFRMPMPDGTVAHAEFKIGNFSLSISGEYPEWNAFGFEESDTAACLFGINVENSDEAFEKAIEAGATCIEKPTDQPWGYRTAIVRDPFGYRWNLRQMQEDLSPRELMQRMQELMGGE